VTATHPIARTDPASNAAEAPEAELLAPPPTPARANILLVDDRPDRLLALEAILSHLGQNLVKAQSGKEALRCLLHEDFAVILLDVKMPGLDGFETAALIRQRKNSEHTPIIFISAIHETETHLLKGYALGAVDFLLTPIVPEVLRTKVSAFVEIFRKTEQLRQQAERLRLSEERFRLLVEGVRDYALCMLDATGHVASWNAGAEQITGHRAEEIIGRHFSHFYPAEEVKRGTPSHHLLVSAAEGRVEDEGWRVRKDGSRFWANVIITALCDEQGKLHGFAKVTRDITARRRLEKEILEISDREQHRIGQDLHDDLCQRLAGIEFMSQFLEQNLAPKSRPEASTAAEITKLVRETIARTRDLARGLSPVMLETDGLRSALQELAANTEKLFNVSCEFQGDFSISIDNAVATHLYRIAQESVSNALKHGKAKRLIVSLTQANDRLALTIKDNGSGFPKIAHKTRGMGLRIMQYRAGMIGGSLTVQRQPDGGTSVTCSLQLVGDHIRAAGVPPAATGLSPALRASHTRRPVGRLEARPTIQPGRKS